MKSEMKKMLQERLAGMRPAERQRLYKRALKLRKAAGRRDGGQVNRRERRKHRSRRDDWNEDDSAEFVRVKKRQGDRLDEFVLKLLLEEEESEPDDAVTETEQSVRSGTVIAVSQGTCLVQTGGEQIECVLPSRIASVQRSAMAVGDSVSFLTVDSGPPRVEKVLPRRTMLSRPDPHIQERERLIAANIDAVIFVGSVKAPRLRARLIDRFLIAIERGGARPIICLNKIDLCESEAERLDLHKMLDPYRKLGIPIILASASSGKGIDDLLNVLHGLRCVMVGSSGVGKSSLLNAIRPDLDLKTGTVSEWSNKGKHTTSTSILYELPNGIEIIDTPGIRQFGLWKLTKQELRLYFEEFEEHARACRFADCTHTNEPDCAVKLAVDAGKIAASRHDTYMRILETLVE